VTSLSSQILIVAILLVAGPSFGSDTGSDLVQSAEQKFRHLDENAKRKHPDSRPTELTEAEINAYLASGKIRLPAGVESLRLAGTPGVITGRCRVDFDRVRAGATKPNPLLRLFSGVHDVDVEAQASGSNHQGRVHVNSVAIDGIEVPRFLLQLFVEKYVTPRYPGIGMDSTFPLPSRIDTATVGLQRLTLAQRSPD